MARQPDALGSTVFGYNDAYARLKPFLQRWRSSAASQQGSDLTNQQRPHLLSVDITRAFDSIDTELMLAIVAPVLQSHEYLIFGYLEVSVVSSGFCLEACHPIKISVACKITGHSSAPVDKIICAFLMVDRCHPRAMDT